MNSMLPEGGWEPGALHGAIWFVLQKFGENLQSIDGPKATGKAVFVLTEEMLDLRQCYTNDLHGQDCARMQYKSTNSAVKTCCAALRQTIEKACLMWLGPEYSSGHLYLATHSIPCTCIAIVI